MRSAWAGRGHGEGEQHNVACPYVQHTTACMRPRPPPPSQRKHLATTQTDDPMRVCGVKLVAFLYGICISRCLVDAWPESSRRFTTVFANGHRHTHTHTLLRPQAFLFFHNRQYWRRRACVRRTPTTQATKAPPSSPRGGARRTPGAACAVRASSPALLVALTL